MTRDDEICLSLGREMVRMIHDVRKVAGSDSGYARRLFTFPGGEVHVLLANKSDLADVMETAAEKSYEVRSVTPPSQRN